MTVRLISDGQRKKIAEFFSRMRDTAQRNFEAYGFCEPVAILMTDEQDAVLPLRQVMDNKDVASAVLNKVIQAAHPLAFVLVVEAWMAMAQRDAKIGEVTDDLEKKYERHLTEAASDGKEKPKAGVKEVVMLQCSSATGENFMLSADIVRNEGSKPTLKPWVRTESVGAEGRFMFDLTPLVERQ